jgi:hypothetical protein
MPANPAFHATLAEWRTVLADVRQYKDHLASIAPNIEDEDQQLVAWDHIQRLDHIISQLHHSQLRAPVERTPTAVGKPV